MFEVRQTAVFSKWFETISDRRTTRNIAERIARLELGLFGDAKFFSGIGELRINIGPGYRVYFARQGNTIIVLLCGGDKSTQDRDIKRATAMAKDI